MPGTRSLDHHAPRTGIEGAAQEQVVHARGHLNEVDVGRGVDEGQARQSRRSPPHPHALIVHQANRSHAAGHERVQGRGVPLRHVARGMDLVVQDHEHTKIAGGWVCGHTRCRHHVAGAVWAGLAGVAHGPGEHDGPRRVQD